MRETGAEACVSSQALAHMLEQVVGPVLRQPADAGFAIEGTVRKAPGTDGWLARIRVSDARGDVLGERDLKNNERRCSTLTQSVLLVLAVVIDPDAAQRGLPEAVVAQLSREAQSEIATADVAQIPDAEASPIPVATIPRQPFADVAVVPRRAAAARPSWQLHLLTGWLVGTGILPETSSGPSLALRVEKPELGSLALSGTYWLPVSQSFESPRALDSEIHFHAAHALLSACRSVVQAGRLSLDGCLGFAAGYRWVRAEALAERRDPRRAYFGGVLSAELDVQLTRNWFAFTSVTAALLMPHARFTYEAYQGGERGLFETNTLSGWLAAGMGFGP
ncbi:MAG TPA: hypothetical protein VI072_21440 [Polyangiaceae bacterium]